MVCQQKFLGKAYWSGRPIVSSGKRPKIAPTLIPFQNFHLNLFQPVKINQSMWNKKIPTVKATDVYNSEKFVITR